MAAIAGRRPARSFAAEQRMLTVLQDSRPHPQHKPAAQISSSRRQSKTRRTSAVRGPSPWSSFCRAAAHGSCPLLCGLMTASTMPACTPPIGAAGGRTADEPVPRTADYGEPTGLFTVVTPKEVNGSWVADGHWTPHLAMDEKLAQQAAKQPKKKVTANADDDRPVLVAQGRDPQGREIPARPQEVRATRLRPPWR